MGGDDASMTVPAATSRLMWQRNSHVFEFNLTCFNVHLRGPKYLWIWVFDTFSDGVGTTRTVTGDHAMTASRNQPPRCLPGFAASDGYQYQDCLDGPGAWLP